MKLILLATTALLVTTAAHAGQDACRAKALQAAEEEYGNDPDGTKVQTVTKGQAYRVAVGIGNAEDGEHDYMVTFPQGCDGKTVTQEIAP